jgi:macrolide transport system ATP-binding/permease protein
LLLANGRSNFTVRADLNWQVLGVAAALSLLTGLFFGLIPALQATRVDVMPALKETRTGQPQTKQLFRRLSLSHGLMVCQIAISLVMLVAAGLFVRTLSNLQSVELGFNRESVLLFQLNARKAGYKDPDIVAFYRDLRRHFSTIPGVRAASLSEGSIIGGETGFPLSVAGSPPNPANRIWRVGPAFFTTMQIPILAGRDIEERDRPGSPAIAVINEAFAKANFGNRNPLGAALDTSASKGRRVSRARHGNCWYMQERTLWRPDEGDSAGGVHSV